MKTKPRITAAERARIIDLRKQGLSTTKIVEATGRSEAAVFRIIRDVGPSQRPAAKPERNAEIVAAAAIGESNASIARRFGITRPRVRRIILAAEAKQALSLAREAEVEATLANPTGAEVEAYAYATGSERAVRERWPHVSPSTLDGLLWGHRRGRIEELRLMCWSVDRIADELGISIALVNEIAPPPPRMRKRKRKGLTKAARARNARNADIVANGSTVSVAGLAARHAVSEDTVRLILRQAGVKPYDSRPARREQRKRLTAKRDKLLIAMAATMTVAQIARRFGLRATTVRNLLKAAGVRALPDARFAPPTEIPAFLPRRSETTPAPAPIKVDDVLPEPKAVEPCPPGDYLAEIEARHGTAEVLRRFPACDEAELLAALRDGRKAVKAPVDELPQPWLTRAGSAVSRFFGFGRS